MQASSTHANREKLINWLLPWIPYATGLPKGQDREFAEAIANNLYCHYHKQPYDSIDVLTPLAHLEANK